MGYLLIAIVALAVASCIIFYMKVAKSRLAQTIVDYSIFVAVSILCAVTCIIKGFDLDLVINVAALGAWCLIGSFFKWALPAIKAKIKSKKENSSANEEKAAKRAYSFKMFYVIVTVIIMIVNVSSCILALI